MRTSLALSVGELGRTRPDLAARCGGLQCFWRASIPPLRGGVWDQPEEAADDVMGALLSRSMLLYAPAQQRWRLHDLMRDLAGGRVAVFGAPADLAARLAAARRRHAEHHRDALKVTTDLYLKGGEQVLSGWRCSTASGATSRLGGRGRLRRTIRMRRVCA